MKQTKLLEALWRLNEAHGGAALSLPKGQFLERALCCDLRSVDEKAGRPVAFAQAMSSAQAIDHVSYQWFATRFDDFVCVERIVVEKGHAGHGRGASLFGQLCAQAQVLGKTLALCQVHDRPSNKAGHDFVQRLGFSAIESVMLPSREIVTMYQRSIAIATP